MRRFGAVLHSAHPFGMLTAERRDLYGKPDSPVQHLSGLPRRGTSRARGFPALGKHIRGDSKICAAWESIVSDSIRHQGIEPRTRFFPLPGSRASSAARELQLLQRFKMAAAPESSTAIEIAELEAVTAALSNSSEGTWRDQQFGLLPREHPAMSRRNERAMPFRDADDPHRSYGHVKRCPDSPSGFSLSDSWKYEPIDCNACTMHAVERPRRRSDCRASRLS